MVSFDFQYKKGLEISSGYIIKGKNFRASIIKFPTMYTNPLPGTETVEVYHIEPKEKPVGSLILLHGLGTINIPFLLWMGIHIASAGVRTFLPILPGNLTRTANGSTSGREYFSTDVKKMVRFWEHAVIDVLSILELAKERNWWHENNCLVGYCLGGMISVILSALSRDFKKTITITSGGDIATLMWYSPTLAYFRRDVKKGFGKEDKMDEKNWFLQTFENDIKKLPSFRTIEEMLNSQVHPVLKIDPLAYARFVDSEKVVFIEALFDKALPLRTRKILWQALGRPRRYIIPSGHVTWLPFQYFLGSLVLREMNIKEFKRKVKLLEKPKIEEK
ncbi:alpha/beta hydrolase [Pseudothermotoga sp. U03pept]|uniref:alpha/beta hydrolase n=1 Tax=Pseudothermotoga sp. U03pept TaxID=3447012 RepID=UPI003F05EB2D